MGLEAFAERAGGELLATGAIARKRTVDTSGQLTVREAQIARLARDGLSNPEIGTGCSLARAPSSTTLHKVFAKLDITSRSLQRNQSRRVTGRRGERRKPSQTAVVRRGQTRAADR